MANTTGKGMEQVKVKRVKHSQELMGSPKGPGITFLSKELSQTRHSVPPQTFRVERSSILSQVKAFLPQLEKADKQLQERLQGAETSNQLDIENVEEGDPCIQMDLAVVPLSLSDTDESSSDESIDSCSERTLNVPTSTRAKPGAVVEL